MQRKKIELFLIWTLLAALAGADAALACGPFFNDAYLVRNSELRFLDMPNGYLRFELSRIQAKYGIARGKAKTDDKQSPASGNDGEIGDLVAALKKTRLNARERGEAVKAYRQVRDIFNAYVKAQAGEAEFDDWYIGFRRHERKKTDISSLPKQITLPASIPREFTLYLQAALSYHRGYFLLAANQWNALLALPESERQYRSTWAAFMAGKACLSARKAKEAIPFFKLARSYAKYGFRDSIDLAEESYGWQALAEYETGDYEASLRSYMVPMDVWSVRWVCLRMSKIDRNRLTAAVKDDFVRDVLIGWVVSRMGWTDLSGSFPLDDHEYKDVYVWLLKIIEAQGGQKNIANAERIAWIYYESGDFDKARRWLALASKDSFLAQWITTKLLMRDEKTEEALAALAKLPKRMDAEQGWEMFYQYDQSEALKDINTHIGVLRLHRNEFVKALEAFSKGLYWEDLAYVAEKVVTSDELEAFVKRLPRQPNAYKLYAGHTGSPMDANALRHLLAKRLVREGKIAKALVYIPPKLEIDYWPRRSVHVPLRNTLKGAGIALSKAEDKTLPARERAASYYRAGIILRHSGMELMGTELEPDWSVYGGEYAPGTSLTHRFAIRDRCTEVSHEYETEETLKALAKRRAERGRTPDPFEGSAEEERRVLASLPDPCNRFHYRYRAAELMWKSAKLLPNNDPMKARALYLGGSYLKDRDPDAADRFYKALVMSCPKTKLGRKAKAQKWFPPSISR